LISVRSSSSSCGLISLIQPLPHHGDLFRVEAHLTVFAAGVIDVQDPERMPATGGTFGATAGVVDEALNEGAAENGIQIGEFGNEPGTGLDCASSRHLSS
jgi:hypothetical protein